MVIGHQRLGHRDEIPGLVPEKAGGLDHPLQLLPAGARQRPGVGVAAEQGRGHQVHARVGTLGRKDRRDQELVGVAVVQRAPGVGVEPLQPVENLGHAALGREPRGRAARRTGGSPGARA